MPNELIFTTATDADLPQILELQARNLEAGLSAAEAAADGFVTVHHDLDVLAAMNRAAAHVIAVSGERLAGYALVMLPEFADRVSILEPMFAVMRAGLTWDGTPLDRYRYFVMGQVCVDQPFRGTGTFAGLYAHMRQVYARNYDFVVTEVARRNRRSIRAHEKVGFELLHRYADPHGEEWDLILWDWRRS